MRILHISSALVGGGAETQLKLLLRGLADRGNEVGVVYLNDDPNFTQRKGIECFQIPRGAMWNLPGLYQRIAAAIDAYQPDVVHAWLPEIMTIPAAVHCRVKGIPCLSAQRRVLQKCVGMKEKLRDWLIPVSHLLAHRCVCNFPYDHEPLIAHRILKYRNTALIRNGFSFPNILPKTRPGWLRDDAFKLIFAGRLSAQKRVDVLIDAVANLHTTEKRLQLGIYGVGECEDSLRKQAVERGLREGVDVQFAGYVPDWQSEAVHFDAFILPSSAEGMPNVLLEAMGNALPCVATNIYEISSFVDNEHHALLVSPGDSEALAAAINRLRNEDILCKQLASNGRKLAESLSVNEMVGAYIKLYSQMLRQPTAMEGVKRG